MENLPKEIIFIIIKKLDIDTRRSLDIYAKIYIPENIKQHLNGMIINKKKYISKLHKHPDEIIYYNSKKNAHMIKAFLFSFTFGLIYSTIIY